LIKPLRNYRILAILPILTYLIGIGISEMTERYRLSPEFHWIYSYGKYILYGLIGISLILSTIISDKMLTSKTFNWKKNIVWLFLCLIPVFYILWIFISVSLE